MKFSDHNYLPLNLYLLRRDSIEIMHQRPEDVQADYICVSVIKLPVSTLELTLDAIILGRSMTYDVGNWRLLFKILEL